MSRIACFLSGLLLVPLVAFVAWFFLHKPSCDEYGCVVPLDEARWTDQAARARLAQDDIFRRWDGQ